jgi:hypothetical protein
MKKFLQVFLVLGVWAIPIFLFGLLEQSQVQGDMFSIPAYIESSLLIVIVAVVTGLMYSFACKDDKPAKVLQ